MIGTITKRARQDGKLAWGYSLGATRSSPGRTPARKRIQITKSGFETRKEAADALRKAIEQRRLDGDIRARTVAAGQGGVSLVLLAAPVPETTDHAVKAANVCQRAEHDVGHQCLLQER
jgi:Arm DNA-binding domain